MSTNLSGPNLGNGHRQGSWLWQQPLHTALHLVDHFKHCSAGCLITLIWAVEMERLRCADWQITVTEHVQLVLI